VRAVEAITRHAGFQLNPAKTRQRRNDQRQVVTGIVVNETTNVHRGEFDLLKAIVHDCVIHGPEAANRQGHHDFRAHLLGRIAWVNALNPPRGDRLRALFDTIDWAQ
jgi:RNA-directed DNA polymerase